MDEIEKSSNLHRIEPFYLNSIKWAEDIYPGPAITPSGRHIQFNGLEIGDSYQLGYLGSDKMVFSINMFRAVVV